MDDYGCGRSNGSGSDTGAGRQLLPCAGLVVLLLDAGNSYTAAAHVDRNALARSAEQSTEAFQQQH